VPDPTEPQWLTETEQAAWVALSGVMLRLPGVLDAQLQRDSGLTMFEYFVLSRLSMSPRHALQMCELASIVMGSPSRLSNVVKRLEHRGLVRRESDPGNGRHINAMLTEDGWKVVQDAAPGHVAAVRHYIFDALGPGQAEAVREIGGRIAARTDPQSS
jgi:DNA-binding MarR family transcriptional regulator